MKICVIINPKSGNQRKKSITNRISSRLGTKHEVDFVYTTEAGHAERIVHNTDAAIIVAVGGDGTVNEVARGIVGTNKIMAIVPSGSGNGFARHIGLGTSVNKAIQAISDMRVEVVDCAYINNHLFMCTCGIGLDADVGYAFSKENKRGPLNYVKCALKIWKKYIPQDYLVSIDGQEISSKATLITVGGANQWGNHALITPKASICDGLLDVAIVLAPLRFVDLPLFSLQLITGCLDKSKKVKYFKGKRVVICRKESMIHFDGEPIIEKGNLDIGISEKSIRIIIPSGTLSI